MSEANWFFARYRQQHGPMTLDAVRGQAAAGAFQREDLVWREGMADWVEASQVPELADALAAAPDEAAYEIRPDQPAQTPAAYADPYAAAYPAGAYPGVAQPGGVLNYGTYQSPVGTHQVHYGGFWIRFVAAIVDGLITAVPNFVFTFLAEFAAATSAPAGSPARVAFGMSVLINVISIVIGWLYEAMFTTSTYQATPGKMLFGLKVVDLQGNRIAFGRATGRHFAKYVSALICSIGYIMAAFDERKRGLHDQLAGTLVVYK